VRGGKIELPLYKALNIIINNVQPTKDVRKLTGNVRLGLEDLE
jgi:hypothetical protein